MVNLKDILIVVMVVIAVLGVLFSFKEVSKDKEDKDTNYWFSSVAGFCCAALNFVSMIIRFSDGEIGYGICLLIAFSLNVYTGIAYYKKFRKELKKGDFEK